MKDRMLRIISQDGTLRAVAADTTAIVEECRKRQGTDPTATVALGRLTTAAALMGALLKGNQRLALMVEGNGPLKKIHAETDAAGRVRASIKVPDSNLPPKDGRFDVAGAVGRAGFLHVTRDLGMKEPYRGMVQLHTSEIAEDLAYYLTTSEQTPSTVALGVYLEGEGEVGCAGGFMVQVMPPGKEEHIEKLEQRLRDMPPTTTLLRQGEGPEGILARLFEGIPYKVLSETDLHFSCRCSRQQVAAVIKALESKERAELIAEGEAQVTCEFCREVYRFSADELEALGS